MCWPLTLTWILLRPCSSDKTTVSNLQTAISLSALRVSPRTEEHLLMHTWSSELHGLLSVLQLPPETHFIINHIRLAILHLKSQSPLSLSACTCICGQLSGHSCICGHGNSNGRTRNTVFGATVFVSCDQIPNTARS